MPQYCIDPMEADDRSVVGQDQTKDYSEIL